MLLTQRTGVRFLAPTRETFFTTICLTWSVPAPHSHLHSHKHKTVYRHKRSIPGAPEDDRIKIKKLLKSGSDLRQGSAPASKPCLSFQGCWVSPAPPSSSLPVLSPAALALLFRSLALQSSCVVGKCIQVLSIAVKFTATKRNWGVSVYLTHILGSESTAEGI